MSYCRWSTDDFQCDVYVYAHCDGGWMIHVAGNRQTPPAETRPAPLANEWWKRGDEGIAEYQAREKAVAEWLATAERKDIGLPHDRESFWLETAGECADELERLRNIGYIVPQHAIDALRAEQTEASANV